MFRMAGAIPPVRLAPNHLPLHKGGASRAKVWRGCADSGVRCEARGCSLPQSAVADSSLVRGSHGAGKSQLGKDKAMFRKPLSFSLKGLGGGLMNRGMPPSRDQFANWSWESVSFIGSHMFLCGVKENGLPRRFAPRNDSGGFYSALSFALCSGFGSLV